MLLLFIQQYKKKLLDIEQLTFKIQYIQLYIFALPTKIKAKQAVYNNDVQFLNE